MHILGNMGCHLTCHTCQSLLIGPQSVAASQLDNKNCTSSFKFSWYAVQYTMKCVKDEAKIYSLDFHWKPGYYTCLLTPNPPLPITWVYRLIKLHRQPTVVPQFVMNIDGCRQVDQEAKLEFTLQKTEMELPCLVPIIFSL